MKKSQIKFVLFTLNRRKDGFTLVELIIYIGLLSMLILIFTDIFTSIVENQLSSRNTSNVADDGRYVYSRFIYDVNRAESILQPASFGSSSASLILRIDGQNYIYSESNGNMILTDPSGNYILNGYGSKISNLSFTKVGTPSAKDTVRINYTIYGTVSKNGLTSSQDFQTTAGLR